MPKKPFARDISVHPPYEDATRIVPLRVAAAPAIGQPQLTYRGGPLLANVEVFIVFWGSDWQNSQSALASELTSFFQDILTSSLIDQLGEYSTGQFTIGHGQVIGTTVITSPQPGTTIADSDITGLLQNNIASGNLPQPNANTLYFVYTPSGSTVVQGGSSSCQDFCGYHDSPDGQLFYGVVPYPDCSGCLGGLPVDEALTQVSSHELCEAITDPVPGQGWYDDNNGEIGDICAWQTKTVDGWTVQLEWSNQAGSCA
jgi:hypothetical protein